MLLKSGGLFVNNLNRLLKVDVLAELFVICDEVNKTDVFYTMVRWLDSKKSSADNCTCY